MTSFPKNTITLHISQLCVYQGGHSCLIRLSSNERCRKKILNIEDRHESNKGNKINIINT